jgi:hypothetical protein
MKQILIAILTFIFFLLPIYVFASEEVHLGELTDSDGIKFKYAVAESAIVKTPEWTGSNDSPPLQISKAVIIAKDWVKKKNPKLDDFQVSKIHIQRIGCSSIKNRWYYEIDFQGILDGRTLFGPDYIAKVLMDGTIIEPVIIRPSR